MTDSTKEYGTKKAFIHNSDKILKKLELKCKQKKVGFEGP